MYLDVWGKLSLACRRKYLLNEQKKTHGVEKGSSERGRMNQTIGHSIPTWQQQSSGESGKQLKRALRYHLTRIYISQNLNM